MALMFWIALMIIILCSNIGILVEAKYDPPLGVVLGMAGSDLPDPKSVVELCHKYGFKKIRLLDSNYEMMQALINQNITVSIGIKNDQLPMLSGNLDSLEDWYTTAVEPYIGKLQIEYIVVGNEAVPGPFSKYLPTTIRRIMEKLFGKGLNIGVTTAVSTSVLDDSSFPPSNTVLKSETRLDMIEVIEAIQMWHYKPVLMLNLYPYFYYLHSGFIGMDFFTFTAHKAVYWDGDNGYWNMLDFLLDAFYSALGKQNSNYTETNFVVGASGWPSAGSYANPGLAATYNQNFMRRIVRKQGTPARPTYPVTGFVYALFNENKKPPGPYQHFGLFYTNKTPVYRFSVPRST